MWNSCVIWEPNFQVKIKTNGTVSIVEKKLIEKKYITDFLSVVDSEHVSANIESSHSLCQLWLGLCLCSTPGRPRRHKFAYILFSISTYFVYRSLPPSHDTLFVSFVLYFLLVLRQSHYGVQNGLEFHDSPASTIAVQLQTYSLLLCSLYWNFVHIYSPSPLTSTPKSQPT